MFLRGIISIPAHSTDRRLPKYGLKDMIVSGDGMMYQIDNVKFGEFVAYLRKERNMTQRELAERLFVSDKTVSKWERGVSQS